MRGQEESSRQQGLRAAFVGLGWWGNELAAAATRTDGRILVAMGCSPNPGERAAFAARFGCPVATNLEAVLAATDVDAVVLATPHSLHAPQAIAAARSGRHVLVEKPLTVRHADALDLVDACRSAGVVLAAGHNRRLLPQVDRLRELLAAGALGDVLHVEANFSTAESRRFPAGHWRTLHAECPGGGMTVLGVHVIDWLHHLFGPVAEVTARFGRRHVRHDGDDVAWAGLVFRSGLMATLVSLYAAPYVNRFEVHGSAASVLIEAAATETPEARPRFVLRRQDGTREETPLPWVDTLRLQLERFAAACAGDGAQAVDGVEAARNVAVLEALTRSAASGRPAAVVYGEP